MNLTVVLCCNFNNCINLSLSCFIPKRFQVATLTSVLIVPEKMRQMGMTYPQLRIEPFKKVRKMVGGLKSTEEHYFKSILLTTKVRLTSQQTLAKRRRARLRGLLQQQYAARGLQDSLSIGLQMDKSVVALLKSHFQRYTCRYITENVCDLFKISLRCFTTDYSRLCVLVAYLLILVVYSVVLQYI